ncbi:MAG TPA: plastocyanin/azurin family copper-binding protein, partial [Verrucomicrobiae bacterium]|nr:plastocyanin/azurin family copper-binding protein [Verrucomicrobiae bacterium]
NELKTARAQLAKLAAGAGPALVRQAAWAALALADDSFDAVWREATKSPASFADLLNGIPLLNDPDFRSKAYEKVKPLLDEHPAALEAFGKAQHVTSGRFVRIELPRRGTLTLAEVQVFSDGKNIAPQGSAKQSSTANGGVAARAIDGKTDGAFGAGTSTHTRENQNNPWWELDLGGEQPIESVVVWNRTDGELGKRLDGFTLTVLDAARHEVFKRAGNPAPDESARIVVGEDPVGAIRRAAIRACVSMNNAPEAVFSALVGLIARGEQVPAAARGLRVIPRAAWPKAQAVPAVAALVAWAKTISTADRTTQDYIEAVQLASDLTGLLPADKAAATRNDLRGLRVSVFVIRTVREQMRYDTPRVVVEAGKPFEIIVENGDFMPHNLAIVKPGTREKVGAAAATMRPDDLDSQGRAYLPKTSDVLAATKLLDPGQRETLKLAAPDTEGIHEYVCTFPGHFQSMWGQLVVTKDVDAYLQAHPEAPLPAPAVAGEHEHDHH